MGVGSPFALVTPVLLVPVEEVSDLVDHFGRDHAADDHGPPAAPAAILRADAVVPLVHQRIVTGVATSVSGALLDPYERTLVGTGTRR